MKPSKKYNTISEKVIEDILVSDKSILADLLSVNTSELSLIARQKTLPSGKLDMLYLYRDEILLIELKVVAFHKSIISQIERYEQDLIDMQRQNNLVRGTIRKVVIVAEVNSNALEMCLKRDIDIIAYQPEIILQRYYENFRELSIFLKVQSGDYGVVRLGLIKRTLKHLSEGTSVDNIPHLEKQSTKTIKNKISIGQLLGLVHKFGEGIYLTELGIQFVKADDGIIDDRLSKEQIDLLTRTIQENPFYSSVTYTIFSLVETVFILSKNSYPVSDIAVMDYFVKSVGKSDTWKTEKSRKTATYTFSNYACELELLAKVNNDFYITPKGINSILLLQLNRSIKLIQSKKH